jgi:AcrR family transcriptional regulator
MVNKLLKGATKVFGRAGYHGATVEEIAGEAEVWGGAVYQHCDNKHDLCVKVSNYFLDSLTESIARAARGIGSPQRRLEKIIVSHIGFFENNPDFFRLYLIGKHDWIINPDEHPKTQLLEEYREYNKILSEAISALVNSKVFINIDSENAAYYMSELAYSAGFQRAGGYSGGTKEEDTEVIINLFMEGLGKRKKKN